MLDYVFTGDVGGADDISEISETRSYEVKADIITLVIRSVDRGISPRHFATYVRTCYPNLRNLWVVNCWLYMESGETPYSLADLYRDLKLNQMVIITEQGGYEGPLPTVNPSGFYCIFDAESGKTNYTIGSDYSITSQDLELVKSWASPFSSDKWDSTHNQVKCPFYDFMLSKTPV